ncbi:MAG: PilZ domain-containing protein [Myxococcales bacterium]
MSEKTSSTGVLDPVERRRHSRSYVAGVALLSSRGQGESGACLVRNLSTNGALLLSSPPLAPGETCRMVLTAPGLMGEEIDAQVHRAGTTKDGAPWAAVEFLRMTDAQAERLRHVINLELLAADAPAVLVVDGSMDNLKCAAAQLATHSRRAHLAVTSLQAINWLNEHGRRIALALIGDGFAGSTRQEFLDFIGENYPRIHRAEVDCALSVELLRAVLDRVEAESPNHSPWRLSALDPEKLLHDATQP